MAAGYGRRDQLRAFRDKLVALGHIVTSRWIDTEWVKSSDDCTSSAPPEERQKYVGIDLDDLDAAECCISFTEALGSGKGKRGGRHVEFGYALHAKKRLILVGNRENLFHFHLSVEVYSDEEACIAALVS